MQGWIISIIILQVYLDSHAVFVLQTLLYHIPANAASLLINLFYPCHQYNTAYQSVFIHIEKSLDYSILEFQKPDLCNKLI